MDTTLTFVDFAALSPLLILLTGALIVLLFESFSEVLSKKCSFYITLATLIAALHAAFYAPVSVNPLLTPWMRFDALAHVFSVFFLAIGLASTLLAAAFFKRFEEAFELTAGEYYFLLLSALFGLILIGSAADFLTIFLGLETLSLALYVLCGYVKKWKISHESAIKYFLMGAVAAAFLLYGFALIYGALGTTRLDLLLEGYQSLTYGSSRALFFGGIALVTLGLAFKAAIVPFHTWAPDVYDGAPTPVTAFMAVGTKAGAFAAFVIIFLVSLPEFDLFWNEAMAFLAILTLIYANYVAMRQVQLRRFFAYSGISHAGFLLIPLAVGTAEAIPALLFYLVVYAFATFGCFAVLAFLDNRAEGVLLSDLRGLFRRSPLYAGVLSFCLLTLAGIPPSVGFFAKFYLFKLAFQAEYYTLVVVALLTTILAAYYYLRIMAIMFSEAPEEEVEVMLTPTWPAAVVGLFSCAAIVVLSVYPTPLVEMLAEMVGI